MLYKSKSFLSVDVWFGLCENSHNAKAKNEEVENIIIFFEINGPNIVGTYLDFVIKYVLWDEVLDWERDIKNYGKQKKCNRGQRRLI